MSSVHLIKNNKYIKTAIIKTNYKKAHKIREDDTYYKGASSKYKNKDKNYNTFWNMEPTLQGL